MLFSKEGKFPEALDQLQHVYNDFPNDRLTIDAIGRIHYLLGANDTAEYRTSIEWFEKELALDPEEFTAHYSLMLCYRALGDESKAAEYKASWEKYKDDEYQPQVTLHYRKDHPADNDESQMLHEHTDSRSLMNF